MSGERILKLTLNSRNYMLLYCKLDENNDEVNKYVYFDIEFYYHENHDYNYVCISTLKIYLFVYIRVLSFHPLKSSG